MITPVGCYSHACCRGVGPVLSFAFNLSFSKNAGHNVHAILNYNDIMGPGVLSPIKIFSRRLLDRLDGANSAWSPLLP